MQWRLPKRHGNHAQDLLGHRRFRAGYDFLLIREASGEKLEGLGQWWTSYQHANTAQRRQMCQNLGAASRAKRKHKPNKNPIMDNDR